MHMHCHPNRRTFIPSQLSSPSVFVTTGKESRKNYEVAVCICASVGTIEHFFYDALFMFTLLAYSSYEDSDCDPRESDDFFAEVKGGANMDRTGPLTMEC